MGFASTTRKQMPSNALGLGFGADELLLLLEADGAQSFCKMLKAGPTHSVI
jgi:hypothetical protein